MSMKPLTPGELTELITGLNRLARNLWWTWNQESQEIFQELSPRGWQNLYHNAVAVLREVSDYELRVHLQNPEFAGRVRRVLASFDEYVTSTGTWGSANAPELQANPVAYFSAEFGFHETLPIAAGGLGILPQPGQGCRPVHDGHHHIQDDDIGIPLRRGDQSLRAGLAASDREGPVKTERDLDDLANIGLVVDVKDTDLVHWTSSCVLRRQRRQ